MTGGGYARVDPDRMQRASQVFEDAATAVRAAADQRNVVRAREGTHVWGSDETGQSFEQGYLKSSKGIFDSLDAVVELMDNLAKGTAHTAQQYRRTEQNNQQAVESMQRSTGEAAGPATSKRAVARRLTLRTPELREPVAEHEGTPQDPQEASPGQAAAHEGRSVRRLAVPAERRAVQAADLREPVHQAVREGTPPEQAPQERHLAVRAERRAVQATDLREPVHQTDREGTPPEQVPQERHLVARQVAVADPPRVPPVERGPGDEGEHGVTVRAVREIPPQQVPEEPRR